MADTEDQEVSSSTALFSEAMHHYQAEPDKPTQDLFSLDDIVDLVGGAQDALDRHIAEDSAPHEVTETPFAPVKLVEPEPEPMFVESEPEVEEPEPEVLEPFPDSTSACFASEPIFAPVEPIFVPKAEPESSKIEPEPQAAPEPEPAPKRDALPAAEALKEAPAPAEAVERPAVTEEPPAPASCLHHLKLKLDSRDVPSPSKAQPHPLMQFPKVVDLLYWRDVKSTGVVFGAALLLLLSLTLCSIVSVCSYIGLALLSVTICFRIYKGILQAIQKSDEGHPFKLYLDREVALPEDVVHKYSDLVLATMNKSICELRRLFLVEDLVDSIKFAVLMWILTYVGGLFNGLTLIILGLIAAFSCPIVYEKHQVQIDHYVALVNNQVQSIVGTIQAKVPGMKRKAE
ncbi:reticulon-4a isoform X5 [Platichthys flesus]|uniref:reticulon-4a isoform X5 n=1 Tax=Platichthys flesus TaxID=8260 RepID=UPI002DBCFDB2|nr:reticulon-4a isoform X5 [Platichthys flesus]